MKNNFSKIEIVKQAQLDLLNELKRICEKNNINYFLTGGTLLGAIRHNGFIPWDDDIDVGMLRKEYDKFLKCCKKDLNSDYYIYNCFLDEYCPNPFSKLKIKGTHYKEKISSNSKMDDGIFIDVFAYDKIPNGKIQQFIQANKIKILRKALLIKNNFNIIGSGFYKKIMYIPIIILSKMLSKRKIINSLNKEMKKYDIFPFKQYSNFGGSYSYKKEMLLEEWISSKCTHVFENEEYSIPKGYKEFLTNIYGDYMKLPPEKDRKGKHEIVNIDLGKYKIKSIGDYDEKE